MLTDPVGVVPTAVIDRLPGGVSGSESLASTGIVMAPTFCTRTTGIVTATGGSATFVTEMVKTLSNESPP